MVHCRKISTTEVRGNKRFFHTQSGVGFWFWPLFGKMIAAPPGSGTFRAKIFIWANSVIIHSLKNTFKVPGGICWQFFPGKMRSDRSSNLYSNNFQLKHVLNSHFSFLLGLGVTIKARFKLIFLFTVVVFSVLFFGKFWSILFLLEKLCVMP